MPSLTCWNMSEEIFFGNPGAPTQPEQLDEPLWTCWELTFAKQRLKNNKAADERGLVAEVLRCAFAPQNHEWRSAQMSCPTSWSKTLFQMLPKGHPARVPVDQQKKKNSLRNSMDSGAVGGLKNICWQQTWSLTKLCFFFVFLTPFFRDKVSQNCFTGQLPGIGTIFILASLQIRKVQRQSPLANQGWWGERRLGSVGSGGSCARRSLMANVPLWIVSLGLGKGFDRVSWDSLWGGLLRHGVSRYLVWALRLMYWEQ